VDNLKERIQDLMENIDSAKIVESEVLKAQASLDKLDFEIKDILAKLEKTNSEIDSLQGFSIKGIVKSIFIDKKTAVEDKHNEFFNLSKKYDELKKEKDLADFELNILNRKINDLGLMRHELKVMLEQREKELRLENSSQGLALNSLIYKIDSMGNSISGLKSTLSLCDQIFSNLTIFSASLREIENNLSWKKSKHYKSRSDIEISIRKARELNVANRLDIHELEKSLREYNISKIGLELGMIAFENEFGILFDNFISDMIMKKRIIDGVANIEAVFQNLKNVKSALEAKILFFENEMSRMLEIKDKMLKGQ
jgi:hypothetical protein